MQLSIIIINYNVKYFLEQCLFSVIKAMKKIDAEIIVIDNNSTDGSFDFFAKRFSEVNFIWNKTNSGFAKANNQALKIAKGAYILFLNPDTIIPEDCLIKCISFVRSKKNNIALGIKMLDGSGNFLKESKRAFPSPSTSFFKLSGLSKLFPHSKTFAKYHLGYLSENKNHEVDVLAGAFMMVPKKIIEKTGGFDEDFFMYGEDIDLSYRIQKAGFQNYYFAESSIIHFKGESTKKGSLNYVRIFYTAMSVFVKKHYGSRQAGLFSFFIHIAIFMRAGLAAGSRLLKRKWKAENDTRKSNDKYSILIIGNESEYLKAKNLLSHSQMKNESYSRIAIQKESVLENFGLINQIQNILKSIAVKEIIFCEGELSFKRIIESISQIPTQINIQIFSEGSHAIIGSNDKDIPGNFIDLTVPD
ncbi:MAG: glycosyltransferase family 2 protein [Ginsengibacter sp.]